MKLSDRLLKLNAHAVLILAAERGLITELRCSYEGCVCPEGDRSFAKKSGWNPWAPSADHYPIPAREGGQLVPENIRLTHFRCNQQAYFDEPKDSRTRAAISAGRAQIKQSLSETMKRLWADPEYRAKQLENRLDPTRLAKLNAGFNKPETRIKMKEAQQRRVARERLTGERRVRSLEAFARPEVRERMSAAAQRNWSDPNYRARMIRVMREGRERSLSTKETP